MLYWSPNSTNIESFEPKMGWNAAFSEKDKIAYTNLFFFLKNKKGFTDTLAENYTQMILFKQKYPQLKYNDEQEFQIKEALRTVFN